MATTKKKKVLFVLPSLASGGAERVMINFMNAIDRNIYEPEFLCVCNEGELRSLIDPSIPFKSLNRPNVLFSVPHIYQALKKSKPDIIVSTMAHMNYAVLSLKRFLPKKTRFIVREAITPSFYFKKYPRWAYLLKKMYRRQYPKASVVLSPTETVFKQLKVLGVPRDNFMLLHNPVDLNRIREGEKSPLTVFDPAQKKVRFVACGRLGVQKGFDRLINALQGVNFPFDWSLHIIGEGDERENLEAMIAENGLRDRITLTGLLGKPWPYFAAADCFLLPSRFEGLPNVVLEALACGTNVIATRESGGISEIAVYAPDEAVTIVGNMEDFVAEMAKTKSLEKTGFGPSLLPVAFRKDVIQNTFNTILDQVAETT